MCEQGFPLFQVENVCSQSQHEGSSKSLGSPPCLLCQSEIRYLRHQLGKPHPLGATYWHQWNAWTFSGMKWAGAGRHHLEVPRRRGRIYA